MRKSKLIIVILLTVLFINCLPLVTIQAFERKKHDEYMIDVLFKNFLKVENKGSIKDEISALASASYLAIDQFKGDGQKDLDFLKEYGVKNLPPLSSIDFRASGQTHRSSTHRGWNFDYGALDKKRWNIRKQILLNTAGTIFDFQGNENQKDSFCALIYYIHILADLIDDKSYKTKNGLIMAPGGRNDNIDVIHELLLHFKTLFATQKNSHKYLFLTIALGRYNSKLSKIVNSEGGINSDEKFERRQEYVNGIMKLLTMYLPEMLKEEKFFYDVFYK